MEVVLPLPPLRHGGAARDIYGTWPAGSRGRCSARRRRYGGPRWPGYTARQHGTPRTTAYRPAPVFAAAASARRSRAGSGLAEGQPATYAVCSIPYPSALGNPARRRPVGGGVASGLAWRRERSEVLAQVLFEVVAAALGDEHTAGLRSKPRPVYPRR